VLRRKELNKTVTLYFDFKSKDRIQALKFFEVFKKYLANRNAIQIWHQIRFDLFGGISCMNCSEYLQAR